jgi:hypothetical protein
MSVELGGGDHAGLPGDAVDGPPAGGLARRLRDGDVVRPDDPELDDSEQQDEEEHRDQGELDERLASLAFPVHPPHALHAECVGVG